MTEAELQAAVYKLLAARPDLIWHHCRRGDQCDGDPGFPDLVIVGRRGIMFRELKGDLTRTSREQLGTGDLLLAAGADWRIWRPPHLESEIERQLEAIR